MKVTALVPIKSFIHAKRRLSHCLSSVQRGELCRWMAAHVVDVLNRHPGICGVAVVSSDSEVLEWAMARGAMGIRQTETGLNPALEQARCQLREYKADNILILPADLPFLRAADVSALRDRAGVNRVVIVPAGRDGGTNGLLFDASAGMPMCFGIDSARRHEQAARQAGLEPVVMPLASLACDIDEPGDLRQLAGLTLSEPECLDI